MTNKRTNDLEAKGTHVTHKPPHKGAYTEIYDWKEEYEVPFFYGVERNFNFEEDSMEKREARPLWSNVMKIKKNLRREEY